MKAKEALKESVGLSDVNVQVFVTKLSKTPSSNSAQHSSSFGLFKLKGSS